MERRVLQLWDHFRNPANDEAKALTMCQVVLAAPCLRSHISDLQIRTTRYRQV